MDSLAAVARGRWLLLLPSLAAAGLEGAVVTGDAIF
jgi:hypothetical protein